MTPPNVIWFSFGVGRLLHVNAYKMGREWARQSLSEIETVLYS